MASLSLPELEILAIEGGYTGLAALSQFSAVLLLSAAGAFLHDYAFWTGAGLELTEDEMIRIDDFVSIAEAEIIMSAVGMIMPIATAAVPEFMLLCDGSNHLRVDHPELYEVLDPVFIVDADNFITPDLRDRFVMGSPTKPVGETGGSEEHTLTTDEMPAHDHTFQRRLESTVPLSVGAPVIGVIPLELAQPTSSTGGGQAHSILNPYISLLYGIVAGV